MNKQAIMSVVSEMPSNKEGVKIFAEGIKQSIIDGDVNPLEAIKQLKMIEKVLKDVFADKEVDEALLSEAGKYHKDELADHLGCNFQVKETGTKYDFSKTSDTILFSMHEQQEDLKKEIKERETMLKNLNGEMYNAEGLQLSKPSKSSKTKVVVTIK